MTAEQIRHARALLTRPDNTASSIARLLGASRATIYKYVPEVTTARQAAALPPGKELTTRPTRRCGSLSVPGHPSQTEGAAARALCDVHGP
jgi:hypothetical protein